MSGSVKQFGALVSRPSLAKRLSHALSWAMQAWTVHTTRRSLAELDDHALADLGLSRAQAHFEAERPFWQTGTSARR